MYSDEKRLSGTYGQSAVLSFVEQLDGMDVNGVSPLTSVMRKD